MAQTLTNHKISSLVAMGVAIWTIIAFIAATTAFIVLRGDQIVQWFSLLRPMLIYYYGWGLGSIVIYQLVIRIPIQGSNALLGLLLHLPLALCMIVLLARVTHSNNWQTWLFGERAPGYWLLSSFIYLFILVTAVLIQNNRQLRAKQNEVTEIRWRSSQLENRLSLAQIDALKMQINPHFLFNALNSIAALIETAKNEQAYRATELLGDLLRATLSQSSESLIPLKDELVFVNRYIELEQVRFAERFVFQQTLSPQAQQALVPALILQPLIENSFKHAVAKSRQTVTITLNIWVEAQQLHILLQDDAEQSTKSQAISAGYGLGNITDRLHLLYQDKASIYFASLPSRGFSTNIVLPLNLKDH